MTSFLLMLAFVLLALVIGAGFGFYFARFREGTDVPAAPPPPDLTEAVLHVDTALDAVRHGLQEHLILLHRHRLAPGEVTTEAVDAHNRDLNRQLEALRVALREERDRIADLRNALASEKRAAEASLQTEREALDARAAALAAQAAALRDTHARLKQEYEATAERLREEDAALARERRRLYGLAARLADHLHELDEHDGG